MPRARRTARKSKVPLGLRKVNVPTIPIAKNPVAKTAKGTIYS